MPRIVRGGLIQATLCESATAPVEKIKRAMIEKHEALLATAVGRGAQIVCLQELFYGPYFCAEQETKWYALTERVPDGPTTRRFAELAKKHGIALVLPVYEEENIGVYYNTAAVIDADGSYLGKFRKMHIPQVQPGFYDRHFPEGARCLGLGGAEIVFNPSATVAGLSEYLWKLEQPAHAVANGYFLGAINRPGWEEPWRIGEFYGQSYFCDPRGQILATAGRNTDDIIVCDLDLDMIREVRNTWQFYRDRRPETYGQITAP
jgi:beta-ureidopropionase